MIRIIFGDPGVGKTALLTYYAKQSLLNVNIYKMCCSKINQLSEGGFNSLTFPPQKHVVYSDYEINYKNLKSYCCDGYKIAIPNDYFETQFFCPYAQIFLDEGQKYYDSRMSAHIRDCVYREYQLHRHYKLDISMTCQRLSNIDKNIRAISVEVIHVDSLKIVSNDYGAIIDMVWKIKVFNSSIDAEMYYDSGNKNVSFDEREIHSHMNIFKLYDSFSCEPLFFKNNYNRDFDYSVFEKCQVSYEDYINFNISRDFLAPRKFYKGG